MNNLILLLLLIFVGVALLVVVGERVLKPMEPEKLARLSRWIYPLVGVMLLLSIGNYYLG